MKRAAVSTGLLVVAIIALLAALDGGQSSYDPNDFAFGLFASSYALISVVALLRYFRTERDLLAPLPSMLLLLFLYSAASALYVREFGQTIYGDIVSQRAAGMFYVCCVVGCAALSAGAVYARSRRVERARPIAPDPALSPTDRQFLLACLAIGVVTFLAFLPGTLQKFNFFSVVSYSDYALDSRVEFMSQASAGIEEVVTIYLPVITLLAAGTLLALSGRGPVVRIVGFAILASYVATNTLAGARRMVIDVLVFLAVYFHYRIRPIRWGEALTAAVSIYLFVNLLSIARISSDPVAMLKAVSDQWSDLGASAIGITSSGELLTGLNLHRLIDGLDAGETTYTYGLSVFQEILVFVPRVLYPDRPLPLAERFADVFYPGAREAGAGYGFFVLQEGFWAAGLPGVLVSMFLLGYAVERLYWRFRFSRQSAFACLCYATVFSALVVGAIRQGIISQVKYGFLAAIPLLLARTLGRSIRLPFAAGPFDRTLKQREGL